jgi:DNA-binding NtrC family response regulator
MTACTRTTVHDNPEYVPPYAIVLDDDKDHSGVLASVVGSLGCDVGVAGSIGQARQLIAQREPALMLVDRALPDGDGLEFMAEIQAFRRLNFVVITEDPTQQFAIQCLRARAFDLLPKPAGVDAIRRTVARAFEADGPKGILGELIGAEPIVRVDLSTIGVGDGDASHALRRRIRQGASSGNDTVVIEGEPGTEKTAIAEAIHIQARRSGRLVFVNCLAESDAGSQHRFFGSAADQAQGVPAGYLQQAEGGTLVLDDVASLPHDMQARLAHFLDVGHADAGSGSATSKVAVIAIVRGQLKSALEAGLLLGDLYGRLAKFTVLAPTLQQRSEDVISIALHLLREMNERNRTAKYLSESAQTAIANYGWPGNVRELKNALYRSVLESESSTRLEIRGLDQHQVDAGQESRMAGFVGNTFWEIEKELLLATLEHNDGDKESTAKMLGISLKTLYNRLHAYN